MPYPYRRRRYGRKRRFRTRRYRGRRYSRNTRLAKLDRLSLQGVSVRIKYTTNVSFAFGVNTNASVAYIGVLSNTVSPATNPPLIGRNSVFNTYASIYDLVQLKWVSLKSILANFPANSPSMRIHCLLDRKFNTADANIVPSGTSILNNPGTVSRQLNSSQYDYIGMFTRSVLSEERTCWFDTTSSISGIQELTTSTVRGFVPAYLFVLQLPNNVEAATTLSLSMTFEAKFRFRNPKIGDVTSSVSFQPVFETNDNIVIEKK